MTHLVFTLGGILVAGAFTLAMVHATAHRDQPGTIPFVVLSGLFATLALSTSLTGGGVIPAQLGLDFVIFIAVIAVWLVFTFEYTGRGPTVTASLLVVVGTVVLATNLGVVGSSLVPESAMPTLFAVNFILQAVTYSAVAYGILVAARSGLQYDDLPQGGTLVLASASLGLICLAFVRVAADQYPSSLETVATLSILAAVAGTFVVALRRYAVFETGPSAGHLARETVLDELTEVAVIADRRGRLLDWNRAAQQTFALDRTDYGRPVAALLADAGETADASRENRDSPLMAAPSGGSGTSELRRLDTTAGRREFELTGTPLLGSGGEQVGQAYLLRDVTERRTHEQRVDVLNRVLRHNLRNDLDAIHGFAEALGAGIDDADDLTRRINATASELVALGGAVERTERLLARETLSYEVVDVAALTDGIVDRLTAERADRVTVTTDRPASASQTSGGVDERFQVRTDRDLLEAALTEVVDNALEHTDGDVEVRLGRTNTAVAVAVRDEGAGIPDREQAVLLDGAETPLRHGSGLGLWLVHWCLRRLGGDLGFRERETGGSVVTLRIHA